MVHRFLIRKAERDGIPGRDSSEAQSRSEFGAASRRIFIAAGKTVPHRVGRIARRAIGGVDDVDVVQRG
jgi:hypothetical protein